MAVMGCCKGFLKHELVVQTPCIGFIRRWAQTRLARSVTCILGGIGAQSLG